MKLGAAARSFAAGGVLLGTAAACNALSGVGDLEETADPDASVPVDATQPPADVVAGDVHLVDSATRPPQGGDAGVPSVAACAQVLLPAPVFIGGARSANGYFELTSASPGLAGAVVWETPASFARFDVTFELSIGIPPFMSPAAGMAFFVEAAAAKGLGCNPGPYICVLGGGAKGYAVLLRTGQSGGHEAAVPYLAVVDAPTFPGVMPATPVPLDAEAIESNVVGNEPPTDWHKMAIQVADGVATVAIDGQTLLDRVKIPGFVAGGGAGSWGVGASTGQGSGAELLAVRNVALTACP